MATTAQFAKYKRYMAQIEGAKRTPDKVKAMTPRQRIRVRNRCKLCGRPRAVYRKFGICRICFRDMASDGLIPGVMKASW
jgi:small subunit ribosomal protein S14